jgi:hypothetical protein
MYIPLLTVQVEVTATRDPARLLQPTASAIARLRDDSRSGGRCYAEAPRLAVPDWRKGV